jgi:hypothetical protein
MDYAGQIRHFRRLRGIGRPGAHRPEHRRREHCGKIPGLAKKNPVKAVSPLHAPAAFPAVVAADASLRLGSGIAVETRVRLGKGDPVRAEPFFLKAS